MKKVKKNKNKIVKRCFITLTVFTAAVIFAQIVCGIVFKARLATAYDKYGWNLVIVNEDNYIPEDYAGDFVELSNGEKVDSRIYDDLQAMFDDARSCGVYPFVREGYRTNDEQQEIMNEKIRKLTESGYSKSKAEKTARESVAEAGTSEHELGIAVDINADTEKCNKDDVYNWLADNAYRYGFIQRYPLGKTDITGIIYEPWHYRYVGKEAAKVIYENGLCLEEYIVKYNLF